MLDHLLIQRQPSPALSGECLSEDLEAKKVL